MSIFENAALVRESVHVYKQVCGANLRLNGRRYFSIPFKLGQSGSAALPLPRVPPFFYFIIRLFSMYTFFMQNPWFALSYRTVCAICLHIKRPYYDTPTPPWSRAEGSDRSGARTPRVSKRRKGGWQKGFVRKQRLRNLRAYKYCFIASPSTPASSSM